MFFDNPSLWSDEKFDEIFNNREVDAETLAILQTQVVPLGNFPIKNLLALNAKKFIGIDFDYEKYYP